MGSMPESMDLDEVRCCTHNLDPASPARQTILDLERLKKERLGKHPEPKYDGNITTVIEYREQLEAALRKPGRGYPGDKFKLQGQ